MWLCLGNQDLTSISGPIMAAAKEYSYKRLADLRDGITTNVYGIVKYFKKPSQTQSGLYCSSMGIVDESLNVGQVFHCLLMNNDKNLIPSKTTVGDVVRFHRLRIVTFNGCLQGKMSHGFSWLLVRESYKEHSHGHSTFTEKDQNRITELRKWVRENNNLTDHIKRNKVSTLLSEIQPADAWINTVVQVVSVNQSVSDPACAIINAWDGPKPSWVSYNYCQPGEPIEEPPSELVERSHGCTMDIHAYDEHSPEALALLPGQFIIVSNLHVRLIDLAAQHTQQANLFNPEQFSANPTFVGLLIHKGRSYDRGITVLDETEPEAVSLKNRIQGFLETKMADKKRQREINQSICQTISKKPRSGEETEDETSTVSGILANNDNVSHQSTVKVHKQIPDTSRISEAKRKPDVCPSMRLQLDIQERVDELKGTFKSKESKAAKEEEDCYLNLADFQQPFTQTQGATGRIKPQSQASSVLELEHTFSSSKNEHVGKRCSKPSSSQIALTLHSNLDRNISVKRNAEAVQEDKLLRNITTPVHKMPNTSTASSSTTVTQDMTYTDIADVLRSEEVPKIFNCKVKISDLKPKTAIESVYISCYKCNEAKNITILPEEAAYAGRRICCVRCLQIMKEEYRFVAILKDEKSLINVDLTGKDAEVFFCDLKAEQVRKSKRDREKLEKIINALVVEDSSNQDSQPIDCFIATYYKESDIQSKTISYRIVQTRLPDVFLQ